MLPDVKKKGPLFTDGESADWCTLNMEISLEISHKAENRSTV